MTPLDQYFEAQEEPMKGFLLALKDCMMRYSDDMVMTWKWKTPFFYFSQHMLAYISIHKPSGRPYLGFGFGDRLAHPALLSEGRKMIKVLYFEPEEDIDVELLYAILDEATEPLK